MLHIMYISITGHDYNNVTNITVPAGKITYSLTINIFDDDIAECNETFNVKIVSIKSCGFTMGSSDSSIVKIKDNDSKFHAILCYIK